jgi:hypothetical protein
LLVDKTDRLSQQAYKFERSSRSLKNEMWCRKMKLYAMVTFIIVVSYVVDIFDEILICQAELFLPLQVIILFIAALICGIKFDQCKS